MDTIKNLQQEINSLKKTNIKLKRKTSTSEDNYRSTLATPTPTVARSRLPSETSTIKVNLKRRLQYKSSALSLNVRPHKVAECAKWLVNNSDLYKEEGITFNDSWLEGCSNISLVDDSDECSERLENVESNAANKDSSTDCQTQQTRGDNTDNEDDWSEDQVEIPAGVTDTMLTAPDFVTDNERQYILNIASGEGNRPISILKTNTVKN